MELAQLALMDYLLHVGYWNKVLKLRLAPNLLIIHCLYSDLHIRKMFHFLHFHCGSSSHGLNSALEVLYFLNWLLIRPLLVSDLCCIDCPPSITVLSRHICLLEQCYGRLNISKLRYLSTLCLLSDNSIQ